MIELSRVELCWSAASAGGEPFQRAVADATDPPLRHHCRTEALVEIDRRLVPVEHGPLEARAVALDCERSDPLQQRLADAASPHVLVHEQVFEPDALLSAPGRVAV